MERVKTIFEYNEELKMYDKIVVYLQNISKAVKINSKSLYNLMSLFIRERDYFLDTLNDKETEYDLIKTPKNEFFIGVWNRDNSNEIIITPKDEYNRKIYEKGLKLKGKKI